MVSSGTEDEDEQNPASGALSGLLQDEKSGTLNISVFHTSTSLVKLNAVNALREMTALEAGSSDSSVPGTVSLNVTPEMMLATRQQWFAHNSVRFSQLDSFEEDVSRHVGFDSQLVGSVGAVTTGLSVGYIIWVVRGGMLLSGLLAQMPAWQMLDPLLVIDGPGRDREDDGETIYSIVENQERLPEQVAETADSVSPEKCLTAVGAKG
jgi:hypothetical protein